MGKSTIKPTVSYTNQEVNTFAFGALLTLTGSEVITFPEFIDRHKADWEARAVLSTDGTKKMPIALGIFDENSPEGQAAWQNCRLKHLVTGSQAGPFLGLSEHTTPAEKIGEYVGNHGGVNPFKIKDQIDPAVALRGHRLEAVIADIAYQVILKADPEAEQVFDPGIYEDAERSYISFSPDRLLWADLDGTGKHFSYLEIKTASVNGKVWKDYASKDLVPPTYYAQCALGMHVFNVPDAYIAIGSSYDAQSFKLIHIVRDMAFENAMLQRFDECWDFASRGEVPPLDWGGALPGAIVRSFFREYGTPKPTQSTRKSMDFPDEDGSLRAIVEKGIEAKEAVDELKKQLKEAEENLASIGAMLIDATGGFQGKARIPAPEGSEADDVYFELKGSTHTKGEFDEEGFRAKYPEVYQECISLPAFSKTTAEKKYPHLVAEFSSDPAMTVTDKDTVKAGFWKGSKS